LLINFCLVLALFWGCALSPEKIQSSLCHDCTFKTLQPEASIPLYIALRNIKNPDHVDMLHVYLEGDGRPWRRHGLMPATNPSSHSLTALSLMMLDDQASVYLNRPCYGRQRLVKGCTAALWTQGRYSQNVVNSLTTALESLKTQMPKAKIILIGHSGGGTLAMLLAQKIQVAGIITLGANLDHRQWTEYFGYLPLDQSLDFMRFSPLPSHIPRWHLAMKNDVQVPYWMTEQAAQKDPLARFILFPEGDHQCCWAQHWPIILKEFKSQSKSGI
jgi:predicted alpha/beta hydrolase family esterase